MKKHLVIVESPSKSKTIEKYLGKEYRVVSSKGHVCDLATSGKEGLGIDVDHDFEPKYKISKEKKEVVKELKEYASKAQDIYLASDPDREGEAIAWHLARVLDLNTEDNNRIVFHEITKPAILEAMKEPRKIDMDLVKSQETRRMLDRIIGFKLSKLLQNKIQSKSAGRVQSVALKLIVDRENEIKAFKQEEYWTIHAQCKKQNKAFEADLVKVEGKKPKIKNEEEAKALLERCNGEYIVSSISKKQKKKQPKLPFTTSTMQQEASTKLGFGAKKTMSVAQKMYEGIDLGGNMEGLITYMRSDSTRLSDIFVSDAKEFITNTYGKEYVGHVHQKNGKNTQDAHEAIRPTNINRTPESIKDHLTNDQYRLYSLIYARTLASLMKDAVYDVTSVKITNNDLEFSASGQTMTFDGYYKVYSKYEKQSDALLPKLEENEVLKNVTPTSKQHFTEPPARYTEAKLIKAMEELGIGRPSTYATIIDTIQTREYVILEKKTFKPTESGLLTNKKLLEYFDSIINVDYTAKMENELDEIAKGQDTYVHALTEFEQVFEPLLEKAYDGMEKIEPQKTGEKCPECGGDLVIRKGRFGEFVACSNYPECKYVKADENKINEETGETCPQCGSPMIYKMGRFGPFKACSNYPKCKTIIKEKKKKEE